MIIGNTDPGEAWEMVNECYEDEQLAVITAMKDIMQLKMLQDYPS